MKKRMLFVYNPRSGKGAINARLSEVVDVFVKSGYEVIIHPTQRARDAYEKVKDVAVIGLPDKRLGEITGAVISIKEGKK